LAHVYISIKIIKCVFHINYKVELCRGPA